MKRHSIVPLLVWGLTGLAGLCVSPAQAANDWAPLAIISEALGAQPNRLCYGAGDGVARTSDIGCPASAPRVSGSSIGIGITPSVALEVSGTISATSFVGNGSGLTGVGQGDRITSGTSAVIVNSASTYISLSTGGVTWGYFGQAASYLPFLTTGNISTTHLQLLSPSSVVACGNGISGTLRYSSGTVQVCNGIAWSGLGSAAAGVSGSLQFNNGANALAGRSDLLVDSAGQVGIATGTPSTTLTVSGTTWTRVLMLSHISGAVPISVSEASSAETDPQVGAITNGQLCYASGGVVVCDSGAPGGAGDNLGNHTASTTIRLSGNFISNDGGAEGLSVDDSGNVAASGMVKVAGTGSEGCGASTYGSVRYNTTIRAFQLCRQ